MPNAPAIFGISMTSQKSRRWLVVLCYAVSFILVWLPAIPSSRPVQLLMVFLAGWWICNAAIFWKLAKDTVAPIQDVSRPVSLGLLHNALPSEDRLDERIIAVRNAAYYRAYRMVALGLFLMPGLFGVFADKQALLGIVACSLYVIIFTLPQAIILWTEPDMTEEAI